MNNYYKLLISCAISFFIMYFVMFLNIVDIGHIYVSATRIYMAVLMVAPMAILMVLLMPKMYSNNKINAAVIIAALLIFSLTLLFLRTQTFVDDAEYMKAMIPHHSSAILTSENAEIRDPEVKELADQIIKTQKEEIELMKEFLSTPKD